MQDQRAISVLSTTRDDPDSVERMCLTALSKAEDHSRVELLFFIEEEDRADHYSYLADDVFKKCDNVAFMYTDMKLSHSRQINELALRCVGDILLLAEDDLVFEEDGWDRHIDEMADDYPDEIYCMRISDFPAISRKWYSILERVLPLFEAENFVYSAWLFNVAERLGRLVDAHDLKFNRSEQFCFERSKVVMSWIRTDKLREYEAQELRKFMVNGS